MLIRELAERLLAAFPAADAEAWDHVGLSVGKPRDEVRGVAVALDATEPNIVRAAEAGANVLVTHHPVYIKAPSTFAPPQHDLPASSAALFTAIEHGVSIISLHTNLDRSRAARERLASLMGFEATSSLEHPLHPGYPGLGAFCTVQEMTLDKLASLAAERFGTAPRVWGDADSPIERVALFGGSLGDCAELACAADVDAVVCGEAGYHVCQDLWFRGCATILLGHDRSEEPFVSVLRDSLIAAGILDEQIVTIDGPTQWWTYTKGERS